MTPIVLQARMFAYNDAARYRLGVNYQQLPTNKPVSPVYSPYQRDGRMNATSNYGGDPNYVRSALRPINFKGTVGANGNPVGGHEQWIGEVSSFASEVTDEDFIQPRKFWDMLAKQPGQKENFVYNVCEHLKGAIPEIQEKAYGRCSTRDPSSSHFYSSKTHS
jgi:catalase